MTVKKSNNERERGIKAFFSIGHENSSNSFSLRWALSVWPSMTHKSKKKVENGAKTFEQHGCRKIGMVFHKSIFARRESQGTLWAPHTVSPDKV